MRPSTVTESKILNDLVHDLRQPLGNIETSVFYLDLVLSHPDGRVREQLVIMERQVARAIEMLTAATDRMRQCEQCESVALTNPATAGVA